MLKGNEIHASIYSPGNGVTNDHIATYDKFDEMSMSDIMAAFSGAVVRKSIANSHENDEHCEPGTYHFPTWKVSLKQGGVTASFMIDSSCTVLQKTRTYDLHRSTVHYGRPDGDETYKFWKVSTPVTVRARLKSGGHKIIGKSATEDELRSCLQEAHEVSNWQPDLPKFMDFTDDGITVVQMRRRGVFPIYGNKTDVSMVKQVRGFRNLGVLGLVSLMPDHQVVPISGGSKEPFFLINGEIESPGTYTSRTVLVNKDCSGYWYTRVVNGTAYITGEIPKVMNQLTFSDKAMIKLAIAEYMRNL